MIRFVCNNKKGDFNLNDSSSFLGVTNDLIEVTLDMFADAKSISVIERTEELYKIQYVATVSIDNLIQLNSYNEFHNLYKTIKDFKNTCLNIDINSLISC